MSSLLLFDRRHHEKRPVRRLNFNKWLAIYFMSLRKKDFFRSFSVIVIAVVSQPDLFRYGHWGILLWKSLICLEKNTLHTRISNVPSSAIKIKKYIWEFTFVTGRPTTDKAKNANLKMKIGAKVLHQNLS